MSVGVEDTMVADGGAADVGAEVFDGGGSRTKGLDVDAPVGVPDGGVHLPIACLEAGTEVAAEGGLESGNRDEERVVFANKDIALSIKSGGGNNDVEMRVEVELLVPSVENGGEPARGSTEPLSLEPGNPAKRRRRRRRTCHKQSWREGGKRPRAVQLAG